MSRIVLVGFMVVSLVSWGVIMPGQQNLQTNPTDERTILEPVTVPPGSLGILAYFRDGNIYTLNLETGEHIRYGGAANMADPSWHPDGHQIAFGYGAIYTLNVNTGAIQNLIGSTTAPGVERQPRWSPDGMRIIYEDSLGNHRLRLFDVETGETRLINTEGTQNESGARWSPDGTRILFDANPATGDLSVDRWSQIFTMPSQCLTSGVCQPTPLTHLTGSTRSAAWSPDGTRIAFVSDDEGFFAIYAAASDGSDIRRLTANINGDFDPIWSPDGHFICFYRQGESNRDVRIYMMAADGSALTEILADAGGQLDWWMAPDQRPSPEATEGAVSP